MSEQALEAHLENCEQRPAEEMTTVEKSYLNYLEQRVRELAAENIRLYERIDDWRELAEDLGGD